MTTLLEALTWWPWTAEHGIRNVRRAPQAPGMVTLAWATRDACPTLLVKRDGTEVFRDESLRHDHQVTLTGWAGGAEDIVIRAGTAERVVQVDF
ncbi:MAG: hypothetical protein ABMB14_39550 [Myxococcota bacterium]